MQILLLLLSITLALLSWPCLKLANNYSTAREIGLPILITPVSFYSRLWGMTHKRLIPILEKLPFGLGNFANQTGMQWYFPARYYTHARIGPAYAIVSPSEIQIIVADADAIDYVLAKQGEFPKEPSFSGAAAIFGPNLISSTGEVWQRHRRITTPPFNERISATVWRESLVQSSGMLEMWKAKGRKGAGEIPGDAMKLTLHVLIAAEMGKRYEFSGGTTKLEGSHEITYRDALKTILSNLLAVMIMDSTKLPTGILPKSWGKVRAATAEFRSYMDEMLEESKISSRSSTAEKDNLMIALLRASDPTKENGKAGLSDEEILGNIFLYSVAGHDTTANSVTYAITLLSAYPEIQQWIREELLSVFPEPDPEKWEYERAFPKLKRCMALMNETVRLYGPGQANVKHTVKPHQILRIRENDYRLPLGTFVVVNMSALHTTPEYWGSDSLDWNPKRWIKEAASLEDEQPIFPRRGAYIGFSAGPRVCPGRKFAQVEFVAVIARLFRSHRCSPVLLRGESEVQAKKRVLEVVEDSNLVLTLKMLHPERLRIAWEEV